MTFESEIVDCINLLETKYNQDEKITKHIARLYRCDIRRKNIFQIPLKASTTYGPYTIRLARNWLELPGTLLRASILLHEAVHCFQYDRFKVYEFWFKYLTNKKFRDAMETEAYSFTRSITGI